MWGALAGLSVLLPVLVALWCKERQLFPGRRLLVAYRRLPWFGQFLILAFAVHLIVFGSTKTNATDGVSGGASASQRLGVRQPSEATQPKAARRELLVPTVSVDDIVRGYRLADVTTNATISYEMPGDAILCGNWHLRGAYDDVTRIDLGDWRFPLGSNSCDHLWAFVSAALRPTIRDAQHALVATDETLSAIPRQSALWFSADSPLVRRITWEDFALGRVPISTTDDETNAVELVSAQIELHRNGDFITRANDVEKTYRRVNPFDWDSDGLPNDRDPNPYVYDGDHFGPEQVLPEGANTNAYCWIDVVVPHVDALVIFEGDGPSNLADPDFIARADETNRVTLLIGKTYEMRCDQPIEIVGQSDPAIQVWHTDESAFICWPVEINSLPNARRLLRSFGDDEPHPPTGFTMQVSPENLGGCFAWSDACCRVEGSDLTYWIACDFNCACRGCTVSGTYSYEGYGIPVYGASCGCPDENDWPPDQDVEWGPYEAGIAVTFDTKAVIFEDAYTNLPGVVVGRRSTRTTLTCVVNGGPHGGIASFSATGLERLLRVGGNVAVLPTGPVRVPAGASFHYCLEYEGFRPSESEEDIVVRGRFDENLTDEILSDEDKATAVKLKLEAVYEAPENPNASRHIYGVGEKVRFCVTPVVPGATLSVVKADVGDTVTRYDTFEYERSVAVTQENIYRCPATDTRPDITLHCHDSSYSPLMTVVEPQYVVARNATSEGAFWPGDVCMGTLITTDYVGPFTVSFRGVKMFEVVCTNAIPPTGYFATTNFIGNLVHDLRAGAGWIHPIGDGNYWMTDQAGRSAPYANWSSGRLEWKIPIGWARFSSESDNASRTTSCDYELFMNKRSRPLLIGNREDAYKQIYTIDDDGTSAVEKFGYKLSRNRFSLTGTVSEKGGLE